MNIRSACLLAIVVSCGLLFESADAEEAWTQFRGPAGSGILTSGSLPTLWSPEKNIRWRTEVPGQGWSSPVIDRGRIYLTAAIPADESIASENAEAFDLSLLIFDAASGELLSQHDLIRQSAEQLKKIHAKNTHASPTPVVAGERVYAHFGFQGTACADLRGNIIWINRDLSFSPVHGSGGSPILVDQRLIFTCDGSTDPYVAALEAADGTVAWKCPRPIDAAKKFSFSTPTQIDVDGQTQVIAPGSDCVIAIDPSDGSLIWQVDYEGYSVVPKAVYADGILYVSTGFDRGGMLAIDPRGSGNITDTNILWRLDKGVPKTPSVLVHQGLIYMVNDGGVAFCLEAATGEQVWQQRLGGKYSASPVLAAGKIYFTSEAGVTTVIAIGREYREIAENDLRERTLASLAPLDQAIIMRTDRALYRIEAP